MYFSEPLEDDPLLWWHGHLVEHLPWRSHEITDETTVLPSYCWRFQVPVSRRESHYRDHC